MRHKPWLPIKHAIVILIVPREVRVFVRPIVVRGCIWRRGERGTAKGRGARHAEDGEEVEGQLEWRCLRVVEEYACQRGVVAGRRKWKHRGKDIGLVWVHFEECASVQDAWESATGW
jgi:hypothetical protein